MVQKDKEIVDNIIETLHRVCDHFDEDLYSEIKWLEELKHKTIK